ncbi:cytochrome P450 [Amycolatopsis pigmentata]|uniref:Cytochrome P450 n=1 Tax=Amycolatopsis pigmentata TaxID=450801 RepID=A0ABW5G2H8_9PSEU
MTDLAPSHLNAIRLYGDEYDKDPAAVYERIRREHGPVAPILLNGEIPAWFIGGYRELHQVCSDAKLFAKDTGRWNGWDTVPEDWPGRRFIAPTNAVLYKEGDEHRRRAGAISDALADVDQFALRSQCERFADELIDTFAGSGEADLIKQFATRLPLLALIDIYGLSEPETSSLESDILDSLNTYTDATEAHERVAATMRRLLESKHRMAGPDFPSRLLDHPAELTDEEIALDLVATIDVALQPTAAWIGNTIRLMLVDDRFATTVIGGRASVGEALNEVLWLDAPMQNIIGRFPTRDTRIGGQQVREGDMLVLGFASANADPVIHQDDEAMGNRAQMSFSHGEHACPWPAPELAEVITRTAIEVLLDRLPDLSLAVPADELEWLPSSAMRGLAKLPVRFTPVYVPSD